MPPNAVAGVTVLEHRTTIVVAVREGDGERFASSP